MVRRLIFLLLFIPVLLSGQTVLRVSIEPAVLLDGNTVGWYIADELSTITKDGSDLVADWEDFLGSGRDLEQGTETNKPTWSSTGVIFDGADNFMKVTGGFTYVQPEMIYMVFRQISWIENDRVFDGNTNGSGDLSQQASTPTIRAFAGSFSASNANLAVGEFGIIRILFNGASSTFQIDETTQLTGNYGANDMGGFILGARGDGAVFWSNIQVKEIILRNIDDTDANEQIIYNYLDDKYNKGITSKVLTDGSKVLTTAFSDEYQAVWDAFTTKPDNTTAQIWDKFVTTVVASGEWAKLDVFYVYASHTNNAGEALVNWFDPGTFDATAFNAPTFTANEGFTGNGSTQYVDWNWNPNTDGVNYILDDASAGWYVRTDVAENNVDVGCKDAADFLFLNSRNVAGDNIIAVNALAGENAAVANSMGLYIAIRDGANNQDGYKNKVLVVNGTGASSGLPNQNVYSLALNNNGPTGNWSVRQLSMAFAGAGMTQTNINNLTDAFETAMDALGKGVIP